MRVAIPKFFVDNKMLGSDRERRFNYPEAWVEHYRNKEDFIQILNLLNYFYIKGNGPDQEYSCGARVLRSLAFRYFNSDENHKYDDDYIIWNYKSISLTPKKIKPIHNDPFTVLTVSDERGNIQQNLIYGPRGEVIYCVDFCKHGISDPGHIHTLVSGNLDHKEGEGHSYSWTSVPWVWLVVTFESVEPKFSYKNISKYLPFEIITLEIDNYHENPDFNLIEGFGIEPITYDDMSMIIKKREVNNTISSNCLDKTMVSLIKLILLAGAGILLAYVIGLYAFKDENKEDFTPKMKM